MTIAALAGRRPDSKSSKSESFPSKRVTYVREEIRRIFLEEGVRLLICSAAAGADLLALQVAQELQLSRRVILPFEKGRFRATSVVDRGDSWGVLYDNLVFEVERSNQLKVMTVLGSDDDAFSFVTKTIIEEAIAAAAPQKPIAIIVWDDRVRESQDHTNEFRKLARDNGLRERVVLTR